MYRGSCAARNRAEVTAPRKFLWQTEKAPAWGCGWVQSESAEPPTTHRPAAPFFSFSSISFLHSSNFVLNFCASAEIREVAPKDP